MADSDYYLGSAGWDSGQNYIHKGEQGHVIVKIPIPPTDFEANVKGKPAFLTLVAILLIFSV